MPPLTSVKTVIARLRAVLKQYSMGSGENTDVA
jgi:hypothetical protein